MKTASLILIAALVLAGCASTTPDQSVSSDAVARVADSAKTGASASEDVAAGVEAVRQVSASGRKEAPKLPQWTELDQQSSDIERANAVIAQQFALIDDLVSQLKQTEQAAAESAKTIAALEKELEKAKSKRSRWIWGLGIALGGLTMASGIGLLFVPGMRWLARIALGVGGLIMGVSRFFLQFPWVLPLIGGVFVAFGGYVLWRNRQTIIELVDFGQAAKHVPWDDGMKSTAALIESPGTKKAVADAKQRRRKKEQRS